MKNKNVFESFAHAFEGLNHVMWTQKHVRIQLFMVMLVFVLAYAMRLDYIEVVFILSAVVAVLIAELFNTAIEVVVNMITETYHPLAKIAKDVAAAGVLIASFYAVLVGGAIFSQKSNWVNLLSHTVSLRSIDQVNHAVVVLVGLALVFIIVPLAKIRVGHGSILRGGAVSGHTAVAFLLFAAIFISSNFNPFISILALALAVLVAQSRVEGKIHTVAEVLWGALVALVLMAVLHLFSGPILPGQ